MIEEIKRRFPGLFKFHFRIKKKFFISGLFNDREIESAMSQEFNTTKSIRKHNSLKKPKDRSTSKHSSSKLSDKVRYYLSFKKFNVYCITNTLFKFR